MEPTTHPPPQTNTRTTSGARTVTMETGGVVGGGFPIQLLLPHGLYIYTKCAARPKKSSKVTFLRFSENFGRETRPEFSQKSLFGGQALDLRQKLGWDVVY